MTVVGQICRVDLDEQNFAEISATSTATELQRFAGMGQPEQLLIYHDRILAASDAGAFVRDASLAESESHPTVFGSGAMPGTPIQLIPAWPRLFIMGGDSLTACDLAGGIAQEWTVPTEGANDRYSGRSK